MQPKNLFEVFVQLPSIDLEPNKVLFLREKNIRKAGLCNPQENRKMALC